jgi:hypothetical protein
MRQDEKRKVQHYRFWLFNPVSSCLIPSHPVPHLFQPESARPRYQFVPTESGWRSSQYPSRSVPRSTWLFELEHDENRMRQDEKRKGQPPSLVAVQSRLILSHPVSSCSSLVPTRIGATLAGRIRALLLGVMLDLLSLGEEHRVLADVGRQIGHALEIAAHEQQLE